MKHSISFYTLGCKVNQSDTASMEKLFREAGYEIVPFGEASDICLINTCVVTNMGQGKSRRMIRRTIKRDPKPLIVVTGCYPQTAPEEVAALEGVDLLVGNRDRARIVELVEERLGERDAAPVNDVLDLPVGSEFEDLAASVDDSRDRAFLKIQEGCDQYCSYCIIPYARGHLRSRPLSSIRREVEHFTEEGYKEVVLLGIHLGCYGKETANGERLSDAVSAALSVPALCRLRLGSLESVEVQPELLRLMQEDPRFCCHLHLPLQSGCDKILKAMNRPYDTARFKELIDRIRAAVPDVAITTDIIVGFPGETEADFAQTLTFAEACGFAKIHIFPYSKRKGTPAAERKDQLSNKEKEDRVHRLEAVDRKGNEIFRKTLIGRQYPVLWEQIGRKGLWEGLTPNYVRVYLKSEEDLTGTLTTVAVTGLFDDGVLAEPC